MENRFKTLYLSSSGSDDSCGSSPDKPMKTLAAAFERLSPGDTLLLKCGDTFAGDVRLEISGTQEKPIVLSSYGDGAKPLISDFKGVGITFTGEYIEVNGLAFSSPRGDAGLRFLALGSGAVRNLRVSSCDFFEINSEAESGSHARETGGIAFMAIGDKSPVWFNGITVENNSFERVARAAVHVTSFWAARDLTQTWGTYNFSLPGRPVFLSEGIAIRNNIARHIGGDAISVFGTRGAVIEYNTVADCALLYNNTDHNIAWVPIWCHSSDDCVMQYNEVYGNRSTNGGQDLEAFDIDLACNNCIVQYNYSHDNEGGFLLLCSTEEKDNFGGVKGSVIRFNLSVNDGEKLPKQIIDISSSVEASQIYNNTFYIGKETRVVNLSNYMRTVVKSSSVFKNNIFCAAKGVKTVWGFGDINTAPAFESVKYESNMFFNLAQPEYENLVENVNSIVADPGFKAPGAEERGLANGKNYAPSAKEAFSNGAELPDNGGKDYFGNPVPPNLIGAIASYKE